MRDDNLWLSRSWTTRPRRPNESECAYTFVGREEFETAVESGGFLEWTRFGEHLYGTPLPRPPEGKDVLLEINVEGARQVRARLPDALLLFLDAPSESDQTLRLRTRGDSEEHVMARVALSPDERVSASSLGAIMVVNEELEATVGAMARIIEEWRRKSQV